MVADARDLARQLNRLADLAAERFPQDSDGQHTAAGHAGGSASGAGARPASTG
jgi:hypothetical protein